MVYYDFKKGEWNNKEGGFTVKKKRGRRFLNQRDKTYYRSRWEILVANAMHDLEWSFEYEPKRFHFSEKHNESYLPDFYIPKYNAWIEVKGYMDKRSVKRLSLFGKEFPEETLVLIMEEEVDIIKSNPKALAWVLYKKGVVTDEII